MATAFVREYNEIDGALPVEPGLDQTAITTSAASAQSAAFNAKTRMIAISTPAAQAVACLFGYNPTALVTSLRLPANSVFFFAVTAGMKVALIDVT